jgi:glutathione S-transferase
MIKLFYAPGTCALATHIVLEWIGEPYELEKVQLGDLKFLKINALGQVPTMMDGDRVMSQGDALLKYLVHKYPSTNLGDDGTLADAYELDHWLAFFTGDVHPAFFPFFSPARYSTDESERAQHAVKEASYKLVDKVFTHLDQHLEGKTYIVGNRRTIVDAYAFAMIRWGNYLPKSLSNYPQINRFYHYMLDDKEVKQAMEQQGIQ